MLKNEDTVNQALSMTGDRSIREGRGHSRSTSGLQVALASAKVHIQIWKRYKANAISSVVQVLLFVVFFGLFALAAGFRGDQFKDFTNQMVFVYFLGGLLLIFFSDTAIWTPLTSVQRDLVNGTLEAVFFVPVSRYAYFVGYIVGDLLVLMVIGYAPLFIILILVAQVSFGQIISILAVTGVALVTFVAFGVMVALIGIMYKEVQGIAGLINVSFQFLTGAFIPVATFPEPIKAIVYILPHTWAYDLIRYYSYGPNTWQTLLPVWFEWVLLAAFSLAYTVVAMFLLRLVERHAKTKGLHLL